MRPPHPISLIWMKELDSMFKKKKTTLEIEITHDRMDRVMNEE